MNHIISSILEAEAKADEIVSLSTEKAKAIILQGDFDAEVIKNEAITSLKNKRKEILSLAEQDAESKYQVIINNGENDIKSKMGNAKLNVDKASDYILGEILK